MSLPFHCNFKVITEARDVDGDLIGGDNKGQHEFTINAGSYNEAMIFAREKARTAVRKDTNHPVGTELDMLDYIHVVKVERI